MKRLLTLNLITKPNGIDGFILLLIILVIGGIDKLDKATE